MDLKAKKNTRVLVISSTTKNALDPKSNKQVCELHKCALSPQRSYSRALKGTVKGLSTGAVVGWETHRVRGWLQKALGDLCSTFLFLGAGCFGKRVCWQPDPPWSYRELQRRCAGNRHPPSPCWVFPFHTVDLFHNRPPDQLLLLSQHKLSHIRVS